MTRQVLAAALVLASAAGAAHAQESATLPIIHKEVVVAAPLKHVWHAWTTSEGAMTFFAAKANIQLAIGGPYELHFDLAAPAGAQGSEGMKILSYLPMSMLSFEWNAPAMFGELRKHKTWVVVHFDDLGAKGVKLRLSHLGWGEGAQWQAARQFFELAWDAVLQSCRQRLSEASER